jgi:hypothetical protein
MLHIYIYKLLLVIKYPQMFTKPDLPQGPKGSSRNGPNVLAEGPLRVEDDTQISN